MAAKQAGSGSQQDAAVITDVLGGEIMADMTQVGMEACIVSDGKQPYDLEKDIRKP